jgi:Domain of unknown function (DUF4386)
MTSGRLTIQPTTYARTAGLLYLIIAVVGGFSIAYVPSVIIAAGDAAATTANLLANPGLFGLGVFADVVVMVTEVVLSVMLFVLFKPVSLTLSLIMLVSRLIMVVVMAVNLLVYITPLVLLQSADAPAQLQATVLSLFDAHQYGIYVWDIFFGFHLAVLGYLIFSSGYFPRPLGIAILVGSLGYFLEGLVKVTFFDNAALGVIVVGLLILASISELAFAFWLLIKGLNLPGWDEKLAAA